MADENPNGSPQEKPPSRPAPPPYQPDRDLIGHIERGQKPPKETRER